MRYCQNCGNQFDANGMYCPKCGTPANQGSNNGQVTGNGQVYAGQMYNNQTGMMGGATNQKWNVMSIVGFVFSFLFAPVGLILSIIAVCQIKKSHEKGKGFAVAGIIISALQLAFIILIMALLVGIFASVENNLILSTACSNVDSNGDYETIDIEKGEDGYIKCEDYECVYYYDDAKFTGTCDIFYDDEL